MNYPKYIHRKRLGKWYLLNIAGKTGCFRISSYLIFGNSQRMGLSIIRFLSALPIYFSGSPQLLFSSHYTSKETLYAHPFLP